MNKRKKINELILREKALKLYHKENVVVFTYFFVVFMIKKANIRSDKFNKYFFKTIL